MVEGSWRRNHRGEIIEEKALENRGVRAIKGESYRRHLGGISLRRHLAGI